jgi:purine-binding chemotaxis protein CheW
MRKGIAMVHAANSPPVASYELIVQLDWTCCAIPLIDVLEVMRPLALERVAGAPNFVMGLALIRASPVPVIDLNVVVSGETSTGHKRFITLRVEDRIVALAVRSVVGIAPLDISLIRRLPPLLKNSNTSVIESITKLDSHFLVVLNAAHLLSEQQWAALYPERAAP